jgi:hypothetical protein
LLAYEGFCWVAGPSDASKIEELFGSLLRRVEPKKEADPEAKANIWIEALLAPPTQSKSEASYQFLIGLLDNESRELRGQACLAIGKKGDRRALSRVATLLNESELPVRMSALSAVGSLGRGAYMWKMLECCKADEPFLRFGGVVAIRNSKSEEGLPVVLSLQHDPEKEVRFVVADALGTFGGDKARIALQEMVSDPDPEVRKTARASLEEIDADLASDKLLQKTNDLRPEYIASRKQGMHLLKPSLRDDDVFVNLTPFIGYPNDAYVGFSLISSIAVGDMIIAIKKDEDPKFQEVRGWDEIRGYLAREHVDQVCAVVLNGQGEPHVVRLLVRDK